MGQPSSNDRAALWEPRAPTPPARGRTDVPARPSSPRWRADFPGTRAAVLESRPLPAESPSLGLPSPRLHDREPDRAGLRATRFQNSPSKTQAIRTDRRGTSPQGTPASLAPGPGPDANVQGGEGRAQGHVSEPRPPQLVRPADVVGALHTGPCPRPSEEPGHTPCFLWPRGLPALPHPCSVPSAALPQRLLRPDLSQSNTEGGRLGSRLTDGDTEAQDHRPRKSPTCSESRAL